MAQAGQESPIYTQFLLTVTDYNPFVKSNLITSCEQKPQNNYSYLTSQPVSVHAPVCATSFFMAAKSPVALWMDAFVKFCLVSLKTGENKVSS